MTRREEALIGGAHLSVRTWEGGAERVGAQGVSRASWATREEIRN